MENYRGAFFFVRKRLENGAIPGLPGNSPKTIDRTGFSPYYSHVKYYNFKQERL